MKIGDYVIVTDSRGSYSGVIRMITERAVSVQCQCCFVWKIVDPEKVKIDVTHQA